MPISKPMVNGRSGSFVKYLTVCGLPSSRSVKSSFDRFPIKPPDLLRTEHKTLTTSTSTLMDPIESSASFGVWGGDWGVASVADIVANKEALRIRRVYVANCIRHRY